MKKFLLIIVSSFIAASGFAQSNLIVFAENGESFTMTVDGSDAENEKESKVKFEGISGEFVQVKITFKDQFPEPIKKSWMIEPNSEITLVLKQNKKGAYVLRPMSTVPINSIVRDVAPVHFDVYEDIEAKQQVTAAPVEEVVTTKTTTTSESVPTSINMGVDSGTGGIKMNVNININDSDLMQDGIGVSTTATTTTTTTTTTTSSSSSQDYSDDIIEGVIIVDKAIIDEPIKEVEIVCPTMLDSDYNSAKNSIKKKSFADEKMILAKQIIKGNCVSTNQIIGIMELFDFEDDKVEFAKIAYDRTTDPQNYYRVNDAFTFSSSTDELNEFLEGK